MNLDAALAVLLLASATAYVVLGVRLLIAPRDVGTLPIGILFIVISFWMKYPDPKGEEATSDAAVGSTLEGKKKK